MMFGLEKGMIIEKYVMKPGVYKFKMLSFLLKVTKRNKLCNYFILRKIEWSHNSFLLVGKARDARFFFSVK